MGGLGNTVACSVKPFKEPARRSLIVASVNFAKPTSARIFFGFFVAITFRIEFRDTPAAGIKKGSITTRPEKGGWFFLQRGSTRSQSEAESLFCGLCEQRQ